MILRTLSRMQHVDPEEDQRSKRVPGSIARATHWLGARWLLLGVVTLTALYHWLQALARTSPWIFPDELRYTEFARAAADGVFQVAGERRVIGALQGYLLAPAWLVDDAGTAWSLAKLINVVAFCLTAVPVYLLARRFVSSRMAVLAALASALLPISFYSGTMLQESIALPVAATAALVTVQLVERFSWARLALLFAVCAVGAGVRAQLTILPVAAAVAFFVDAAASRMRRSPVDLRRMLSAAALLGIGVVSLLDGSGAQLLGDGWANVTAAPGMTLDAVINTLGAAIVGVAVIPAVALLATPALLGSTDRPRAAFAATVAGFGAVFIAYTGLKSASLDFIELSVAEERNIIYLEPLAIAAVAAVATSSRLRGLIAPALATIALLVALPITSVGDVSILSENPGLSWVWHIGERANPDLERPLTLLLVALAIVGALALCRRSFIAPILTTTAVLGLLSGIFAYRGDHKFGRDMVARWLQPDPEWVDRSTGGETTAVLLSGPVADPNGLYSLAFWNRSIGPYVVAPGVPGLGIAGVDIVSGVDGTFSVGSATHALHTEDLRPDGDLAPRIAGASYRLTRLRTPTRFATSVEGIAPDRWVGGTLTLRRFANGPAGEVTVEASTMNPLSGKPRVVTATVADETTTWTVGPKTTRTLHLPVPAGPFNAAFTLSPTELGGPNDPRLHSLQVNEVTFP